MIKSGEYYMHQNAMDVCVLVLETQANGMALVEWYNLGYTGNPWQIPTDQQLIYMHPDVWQNITASVREPRRGQQA